MRVRHLHSRSHAVAVPLRHCHLLYSDCSVIVLHRWLMFGTLPGIGFHPSYLSPGLLARGKLEELCQSHQDRLPPANWYWPRCLGSISLDQIPDYYRADSFGGSLSRMIRHRFHQFGQCERLALGFRYLDNNSISLAVDTSHSEVHRYISLLLEHSLYMHERQSELNWGPLTDA